MTHTEGLILMLSSIDMMFHTPCLNTPLHRVDLRQGNAYGAAPDGYVMARIAKLSYRFLHVASCNAVRRLISSRFKAGKARPSTASSKYSVLPSIKCADLRTDRLVRRSPPAASLFCARSIKVGRWRTNSVDTRFCSTHQSGLEISIKVVCRFAA